MKILLTAMVSTVLAVGVALGQTSIPSPQSILNIPKHVKYKEQINSSVSIMGLNPGIGFCSGTVLKENEKESYVLTAKHCINTFEETKVESQDVVAIFASDTDDIALLIVEGNFPNKHAAVLGTEDTKMGDRVVQIGYPNMELHVAEGKIIRITNDWQFSNMSIIPGTSGGGVFNEKGELVGVHWGGSRDGKMEVFEPLKDVKAFLNKVDKYIK